MDPDFMKYYLDTPATDAKHVIDETVSNFDNWTPSFPFGDLQSLLVQSCKSDLDCKGRSLPPGLKCKAGYCRLLTVALYEEKGEEAAKKYVHELKERLNPLAHREEEILNLLLAAGTCRTNSDCVGGRVCKANKCAFRYLALNHMQDTDSAEWAQFESDLYDAFSGILSPDQKQSEDSTQQANSIQSLAVVGADKCQSDKDCPPGKKCIKNICQKKTLLALLNQENQH